MEERRWQERAAKLFCVGLLIGGIVLVLRWLSPLVWVLLISACVAAVVDPLARKTAEHTHLPRKLCAVFYVILLLLLLGGLIGWGAVRLWKELESLAAWMSANPGWLEERMEYLSQWMERISDRVPFLSMGEGAEGWMTEAVASWKGELGTGVGNLLRRTPEAIMTVVVTILSCFYLSVDCGRIRERIRGVLSPSARERLRNVKKGIGRGIRRYLRAYVLLMLLTFGEVWVGLMILGQEYAFLLAGLIALVDVLPVFGAGTVLIPWAVLSFVFHEISFGVGLLILYGVITIVRQVAEPHLVGGSLGIHPLAILLCTFAAFLLFGVGGMLLGPLLAAVLKECGFPSGTSASRHFVEIE
ncbi:MAG: sporulation integral membrane protein YtvI [Clostridia bacterium]|nr:sporulation integral membrane protein YtvI [Clostridia bacterium]